MNIDAHKNGQAASGSGGPKRIVLTGGRSPAALELSRLLHAAGHTVFAAESWTRHLCRASRSVTASYMLPPPRQDPSGYAEGLRSVLERCRADVLLPTCEEIYTIARYRDRLEAGCRVLAEPLSVLERLHHKGRFIQLAESLGLPVPFTRLAENREELLDLAGNREWFPDGAVLKPAYSRFGSKVIRVSPACQGNPDAVHEALSSASPVTASYPWVVQAYLPGRQLCTYSMAHGGIITAHTAYWTRHTAGLGTSVHFEHVPERVTSRFVEAFVQALGFTGQIAFDFKEDRQGRLLPLECNPRTTSGIHLLADAPGIDRALLMAPGSPSAALTPPSAGRPSMLGLAMLLTGWQGKRTFRQWKEWAHDWSRARDVLFRWNDPMPAVEQLRVFGRLGLQRMRTGLPLMELTTSDIEWNGEA